MHHIFAHASEVYTIKKDLRSFDLVFAQLDVSKYPDMGWKGITD